MANGKVLEIRTKTVHGERVYHELVEGNHERRENHFFNRLLGQIIP